MPEATGQHAVTKLPGWRLPARAANSLADCTLIIATYKRAKEVVYLLGKLDELREPPGEIVVVDSSPEPDLDRLALEWGAARSLRYHLVYVRSPKGLTQQRNVGIDICTRDFVYFLDDDAFPLEGYFRHLREAFDTPSKRPIGAVGASIVNEMNKSIPRRWELRLQLGLVARVHPNVYHDCGTSNPTGLAKHFTGLVPVDIVAGGASAFRRKVFDTMRFSEFFYGYAYGEDVEMSLRVKSKWEVLWSGDARCEHHPAPGGRPTSFAKGRMEIRNRYFIWKRHRPHASILNRMRFYGDLSYVFAMDMAWFAVRPWQTGPLVHGFGLLAAALECLVTPPRYEEPPVRRHYELDARTLDGAPAIRQPELTNRI